MSQERPSGTQPAYRESHEMGARLMRGREAPPWRESRARTHGAQAARRESRMEGTGGGPRRRRGGQGGRRIKVRRTAGEGEDEGMEKVERQGPGGAR